MSNYYVKNMKFLLLTFVLACAAMFQYSYLMVYINPSEDAFNTFINQSYSDKHGGSYYDDVTLTWIWSFVVNIYQIGFLIGTLITPFSVDRYGRKCQLLVSGGFDLIGTLLQVAAIPLESPSLLAVGRLVVGVGSGLGSGAITLYLTEVSPTKVRGLVSSFQELSISAVSILGLVLGLPSVLGSGDRLVYLIAIGIAPAFPKLILLGCPDTPKFLYIKRNNVDGARKAVKFYHGEDENVEHVLKDIQAEGNLETRSDYTGNHSSMFMQILRTPHLRKAVLIGTLAFVAQETTGIVPVTEYSTDILENINVSSNVALTVAVLIGIANSLATVVSLFFVDSYGRKKLLLLGLSGLVLVLIVLMVCYFLAPLTSSPWPGYLASAAIVAHVTIFGMGPGTIPWFITSELVPQSARATAQSISQVFNIISNFIVSFAFLPLFYACGPYSFLILFIVPTMISIVYLYFNLPETKNREIAEIVGDLINANDKVKDVERF